MYGSNFNNFSILHSTKDINIVNVAKYVEGDLTSSNISQAITTALNYSSILYIYLKENMDLQYKLQKIVN